MRPKPTRSDPVDTACVDDDGRRSAPRRSAVTVRLGAPSAHATTTSRRALSARTATIWASGATVLVATMLVATIAVLAGFGAVTGLGLTVATALLARAVTVDVVRFRLPNALVLGAGAIGLATAIAEVRLGQSIVAAGIAATPLLVINLADRRAIGFGDVKVRCGRRPPGRRRVGSGGVDDSDDGADHRRGRSHDVARRRTAPRAGTPGWLGLSRCGCGAPRLDRMAGMIDRGADRRRARPGIVIRSADELTSRTVRRQHVPERPDTRHERRILHGPTPCERRHPR